MLKYSIECTTLLIRKNNASIENNETKENPKTNYETQCTENSEVSSTMV